MKIAVLGAGGVGGYYGALLANSGQEVWFLARGAHLAAMRERGLHVDSIHGELHLYPVRATDDLAEVGPVDLVLVSVKSYDLEQAAAGTPALVGPETVVLPLLNGLDAAQRLATIVGPGVVLGGLTQLSSSVVAPGVIRQISPVRRITLGELDGAITPRAERIRDTLAASGAEAVLTPKIDVALWEKFVFIASIGGVCCLARQPVGPILATPESRALYVRALEEVAAVARARNVVLAADVVDAALRFTLGFRPETKPSLLVDLEAGRRLELEAMSGTVVRYGGEVGVHTPVHKVIYAALKPSAAGRTASS